MRVTWSKHCTEENQDKTDKNENITRSEVVCSYYSWVSAWPSPARGQHITMEWHSPGTVFCLVLTHSCFNFSLSQNIFLDTSFSHLTLSWPHHGCQDWEQARPQVEGHGGEAPPQSFPQEHVRFDWRGQESNS